MKDTETSAMRMGVRGTSSVAWLRVMPVRRADNEIVSHRNRSTPT
ncbi:hypothetical protein [Nocardiopsis alba]